MDFKFEKVEINKIKSDGKNPNKMHRAKFEALKKSIQEYGFIQPVILTSEYMLADGEHRFRAAQELNFDAVPAYVLSVKDVDRRILRQIMNKIRGEHSFDLDMADFSEILKEKEDFGKLINLMSYDANLQKYLNNTESIVIDEDDVPVEVVPTAKKGDVWQLGNHRLYCGDSTLIESYVKVLEPAEKIDLIFTDPPYGVSYSSKNEFLNAQDKGNRMQKEIENDSKSAADMFEFWKKAFDNINKITKKGGVYYVCSPQGGELLLLLCQALQISGFNLKQQIIWIKNNHVLGRSDYNYAHEPIFYGWKDEGHKFYGRAETSIWDYNKPHAAKLHPTMKPIALISRAVLNSSREGELVLDPFGGSGSTLIACEKLNRKCRMIEFDEHYCDVIIARWEQYTGKKAVKLSPN